MWLVESLHNKNSFFLSPLAISTVRLKLAEAYLVELLAMHTYSPESSSSVLQISSIDTAKRVPCSSLVSSYTDTLPSYDVPFSNNISVSALYQDISGSGLPTAAQVKITVLPSNTDMSDGAIIISVGTTIKKVKSENLH